MGELVCLVRQALAQLPSREAEVFSLRYFGDLSNPEIAEQLGIRVGCRGCVAQGTSALADDSQGRKKGSGVVCIADSTGEDGQLAMQTTPDPFFAQIK